MVSDKYQLTIDGKDYWFQKEQMIDNNSFHLEKLSYDKGLYRPAEILATINIDGQSMKNDQLMDAFYMKDVKLMIGDETVAENYFVFKVKPIFKKVASGSSLKLELTIYSQDKLMTLDKYSKAWTGQKLGTDIFKDEVKGFTFNDEVISTSNDLQVLDYGSGEFIQPYLVQYNESFYDFLRRTTNRCGEFLYHENGSLHLGMKVNDMAQKNDPDYADIACERYYENILSEGTTTTDYAYNYIPENRTLPQKDDRPYSNPLTYDDFLDNVDREYTDATAQYDYLSKNILNSICLALGGTSLQNIIQNVAVTNAFKYLHASTAAANMNKKHMDSNINPWSGCDDQNGSSVRQFGTYNDQNPKNDFCGKKINMNAEFYALIRKAEKKVGENAVHLEFGENIQQLSIGDKIKVDGENYIVIGVNGYCVYTYDQSSKATCEEHQHVIGVKLYGKAAIPPALPDVIVRESQPQLAFVEDNFDPQKIGRVRVKFAWQPDDSDASPWIRVSMPFATDGAGVKFKPEKDDEVMVSFEEGNVERPYVSGFLLSPRSNKTWSWLPDRGITSKNGHSITFSDGLDGASSLYALSPLWSLIKSFIPNADIPPELSDSAIFRGLTGGMTLSDRFGLYKINLSSDSRSVFIQSPVGDVTLNAFTGINISSPNGDIKIQGKNIKLEASDTVSIESGKAVKQRFLPGNESYGESGTFWDSTAGRVIADVGLTFIRDVRSRTIDKVVDVQLIRTLMDTVLRPIDGTTKIKSPTFVRIEAGKGSAEYPRSARRNLGDVENVPFDFYPSITKIASIARSRVASIQTAFNVVCEDVKAFTDLSGENSVNSNESVMSVDTIKNASYKENKSDLVFNWDPLKTLEELHNDYKDKNNQAQNEKPKEDDDKYIRIEGNAIYRRDLEDWNEKVKRIQDTYLDNVLKYGKTLEDRKKVEDAATKLSNDILVLYRCAKMNFNSDSVDCEDLFFADAIKKVLQNLSYDNEIPISNAVTKDAINDWADQKKHFMRLAVSSLLSQDAVSDKVNNKYFYFNRHAVAPDNLVDNINWQAYVSSLVDKPTTVEKISLMIKDWADETYDDPYKDPLVNQHRWKVGVDGKILLSDSPGKTLTFDKNGLVNATDNMAFTDKSCDDLRQMLCSIGTNVE